MELPPYLFCLFFVFYIFSYLFSKTMSCFSGCLISSAGSQKLFCGIYSALKCSFDEFVWGKKWSPRPIPLPSWDRPPGSIIFLFYYFLSDLYCFVLSADFFFLIPLGGMLSCLRFFLFPEVGLYHYEFSS